MLPEFRKFVGFKILEYFLSNPTETIHLKELAKKLDVSPRSVKIYCDQFEEDGLINREIKGNMHLFSTKNESFAIREMKRTHISTLLKEANIEKITDTTISIAVYGSFANGTYDEKSDLDILVIGKKEDIKKELLVNIMKKMGREIQLNIIPITQWEKMKRNKDPFVTSVLRNHILIKGAEL